MDEAALRGIVCCTVHCCPKIRMLAFAVLYHMPGDILARSCQPGEYYNVGNG